MGKDKAFLKFGGVPLFERVLRVMTSIFASVLLVGDQQERFAGYGVPIIGDRYPGSALGGLYTGLLSADTELIFVVPCDMPFPSPSLIRHICSMEGGFDAVVPKTHQGFEPLFALYRKTCLGPMRRLLEGGNCRVYDLYPEVAVRYLEPCELARVADVKRAFLNINTPEDLNGLKEEL